jgi:beta-galactosidase
VHVAHWGTYLTTPQVSKTSASLNLRVSVDNQSNKKVDVKVKTQIFELNNAGVKGETAVSEFESVAGKIGANGKITLNTSGIVKSPILWTLDKPSLYVAVTTVEQGKSIVDTYESTFGIRTIKFDPAKGFFLNGERIALNGVCNHHDLGALGTAFNTRAAERQLEILKEMGVNALRTSHNMPAPELLDLCDRMGILVMVESFDCWAKGKTKNDYGVLFNDWHARDLRALVRRDRNHPSVIQWSIGNEIMELNEPVGIIIAKKLRDIIHAEDSTRTVTVGANSGSAGFSGFQNSVDVFGLNYTLAVYPKFKAKNPEKSIIGSETSSCVSSRGEYVFPVSHDKSNGIGLFQVSSYDLYAPDWGYLPDDQFKALDENPHVAGEFVWTGFDYLGEPTPFYSDMTNLLNFHNEADKAKMEKELKELGKIKCPSRSSYFGIVDLCGFKKDRFYLYQAHWRPELPMAHILPHWNWADRVGQNTPVHVYTSGDEAELFLNGKSLGRKKKEQFQYRLLWDSVAYQPGELQVIAYINDRKWAENTVKTTDVAAKLLLKADRKTIKADGYDLSFITVTVADKDGLQVPRSANSIKFEISGPAEIVATDNGDATSFESFLSKERKAFNGLALVIVRSKAGSSGQIKLKAVSEGLAGDEIQLETK